MVKLGKREKILGAAFGIFVIIFLIDKGLFGPFMNRLEALEARIKASEIRLKKLLNIDRQKDSILEAYSKIAPYLQTGITEADALAVIIKKIEEMTLVSGVTLLGMKPETETEEIEWGYRFQKVEIDLEGSQEDIINFLYKLENSNYPLSIKKTNFKIKERGANLMEADLDVYFMYFL